MSFRSNLNRHARSVAFAAPSTDRAAVFGSGLLIEFDAQLRGPLEDVEELAERQIKKRCDHRDGMKDRNEIVEASS